MYATPHARRCFATPTQDTQDSHANRSYDTVRILVWSLAGLVVLLAVVFAATAVALPGCRACHDSKAFVTQTGKSSHAKIECVRCHVQPGVAQRVVYTYHLIFGMTLRVAPTGSGPVAGIPDSTCRSCHEVVMSKLTTSRGLSIQHARCSKGRMCTDCHAQAAHGTAVSWATSADMNTCLDCHARDTCTTCHVSRSSYERISTGEWAVTHGPSWRQTHGMGSLKTCIACHAADYCVRCHGIALPHAAGYVRDHPAEANAHRKDCTGCHMQAFCDRCHGLEMPHPAIFTPAHSFIVEQQGSTRCLRCHLQEDCDLCHVRHVHPGGAVLPPGGGLR